LSCKEGVCGQYEEQVSDELVESIWADGVMQFAERGGHAMCDEFEEALCW